MDFPIPKCRFCGKELQFISNEAIYGGQLWICKHHLNASSQTIKVQHLFYADYDALRFHKVEISFRINDNSFIWAIYNYPYSDRLYNDCGLVYGLLYKVRNQSVFSTFRDISIKFYQTTDGLPEQMERELRQLT
jgi:hypothetical protein